MKRCLWIFIMVINITVAFADSKEYAGKIRITPLALEQKGDSLYINIIFDISGINVDPERSLSLIPYLVSQDRKVALSAVMIKGRSDYAVYKRQLSLMGKSQRSLYEITAPYIVIKGYKANNVKKIEYRKVMKYEPWMEYAALEMHEDLCGCGAPPRNLTMSRLIDRVQTERCAELYAVTPFLAYVQPVAEKVKKREMVAETYLDFEVSKTEIRPAYMNNPAELQKITDLISEAKNDSDITVKSIHIVGFASPEGTIAGNQKLSEGRARALMQYLYPRFDYPVSLYKVEYGGENWEGLEKLVTASDMPYRHEVLQIIREVPAEINYLRDTSRKKSLMDLKGGEPYRYMLRQFFPSLRKAVCKIDYEVIGYSAGQARDLIDKRPQNLSLNEMFLVAGSYEKGSVEFIDVFETAVRMFPDNQIANLNAGLASLARKDTVSAERYLNHVKTSSPEFLNAMGVLFLLRDDFDKARNYFIQAKNAGLEMAGHNIDELNRREKSIIENRK